MSKHFVPKELHLSPRRCSANDVEFEGKEFIPGPSSPFFVLIAINSLLPFSVGHAIDSLISQDFNYRENPCTCNTHRGFFFTNGH